MHYDSRCYKKAIITKKFQFVFKEISLHPRACCLLICAFLMSLCWFVSFDFYLLTYLPPTYLPSYRTTRSGSSAVGAPPPETPLRSSS